MCWLGYLSAQQLGMHLLTLARGDADHFKDMDPASRLPISSKCAADGGADEAIRNPTKNQPKKVGPPADFISASLTKVHVNTDAITGVTITDTNGVAHDIKCSNFINASGPWWAAAE
jgi:hypothetical protein